MDVQELRDRRHNLARQAREVLNEGGQRGGIMTAEKRERLA
jgi:hypothetical protein